jgi:hypothetical protein
VANGSAFAYKIMGSNIRHGARCEFMHCNVVVSDLKCIVVMSLRKKEFPKYVQFHETQHNKIIENKFHKLKCSLATIFFRKLRHPAEKLRNASAG